MRALIASGAGRYADPCHPFPETSPLLASILEEAGFTVTIDDDVDGAMTRLDDVQLLVVNAGDPWRDTDERLPAGSPAIRGLTVALEQGMGVLALHCAVSSLRDYPDWAAAVGGMWVPGLSWHPDAGVATITPSTGAGCFLTTPFDVFDERYCGLQRIGHSRTVAEHDGASSPEPTAWVREYGAARIAVDVLGHDARSYESEGHRELLRRLAVWAAAG